MSGGGQGSSGQGGFGQQGMGYGGFGQGYGGFGGFQTPYAQQQSYGGSAVFQTPYAQQSYGGFQTPYTPQQSQQSYGPFGFSGQDVANYYQASTPWAQNQAMSRYGISPFDVGNNAQLMGINAATGKPYSQDDIYNNTLNGYYAPPTNTKEGLNTPYYGTFNNFSAKNLRDYVNNLKTAPAQTATTAPAAAPSMTDLASASGNSGNATWDKLVKDYIASTPIFQPGKGWAVNDYTKNEYQKLVDQYNKQNAATAAAATPAVPTLDSAGAQNMASAMQRYGVSANDLAQSGALSQADYTRAFRPGNQYQGVTNPTQYYQPIYQTQYQNYASPAFAYQGAQNNMRQVYQSPLSGYGYGGYGAPSYGGQGIDGLLGSYNKSTPTTSTPAQATATTAAPTTATQTTTAPTTYGNQNFTAKQVTDYVNQQMKDNPDTAAKAIADAAKQYGISNEQLAELTYAGDKKYTTDQIRDYLAPTTTAQTTTAPTTYGNQNFTAQQVQDYVNQQMKDNPDTAAQNIAAAAKQYGISNEQLAGLIYAGDKTYTADQIGNYLGNATKAAQGGLMSLMRRR